MLRAVRVFHDESTDLAVVVAGPDDHHVGDGAVADPPLLPVQHPLVTLPARPGFQRNHVGAVLGFGQGKGAEGFTGRHPRQILGLLLFGAEHRDGRHREPGMYGVQGGDAAIAAGQFGGDHTFGEKRHPGATVPDDRGAGNAEPPIALGQFDRELCAFPITGSGRCHLRVAPLPDPITHLAFLIGQQFIQTVEIGGPGNRKIITVWELILGVPGIKIGNVLGHRKSRRVHAWVLLSGSNRCVGMGANLISVLYSWPLKSFVGLGCSPYGLRRVLGLLPNGAHNGFGLLAGGFRCRSGGGCPGFRECALDRENFLGTVEDLVDHLPRIHLLALRALGDRAHRRAAITAVPDDAEGAHLLDELPAGTPRVPSNR